MAKIKEEKKEKPITSESQIEAYLAENKEFHYNHIEPKNYVVSSGSLIFDGETGGGIRPGVIRLSGVTEGGKSTSILTFAAQFQKMFDNCKVIYIKSEGRLSDRVKAMSGIDTSSNKWLEFKTNVYETAIGLLRELVKNNPTDARYFFIIDSMDALIPKVDLDRDSGEANKVSGGALLTSDFLRRMALAFSAHGHICALISQVRSNIKINQYEKSDPRVTNAGGGNAALHYSDWVMEFQEHSSQKDVLWAGEDGKSERLGHYCKIIFRKSTNETTGKMVKYPIKYGRTNGQSIWREYEITDFLLMMGLLTKAGAWFTFNPEIIKELKDNNIELEESLQGINGVRKYLEENPNITEYFYKKFRAMVSNEAV